MPYLYILLPRVVVLKNQVKSSQVIMDSSSSSAAVDSKPTVGRYERYIKARYHTDPEYKRVVNQRSVAYQRKRREADPEGVRAKNLEKGRRYRAKKKAAATAAAAAAAVEAVTGGDVTREAGVGAAK